jgi:hypothetical protein
LEIAKNDVLKTLPPNQEFTNYPIGSEEDLFDEWDPELEEEVLKCNEEVQKLKIINFKISNEKFSPSQGKISFPNFLTFRNSY